MSAFRKSVTRTLKNPIHFIRNTNNENSKVRYDQGARARENARTRERTERRAITLFYFKK